MKINLNLVQLHSGTSIPVLSSREDLKYIGKNWFMVIRDFLIKTNAEINIQQIWVPKLFREKDKIIMDEVNKLDILPSKNKLSTTGGFILEYIHSHILQTMQGIKY
jgi:hypothetical protein